MLLHRSGRVGGVGAEERSLPYSPTGRLLCDSYEAILIDECTGDYMADPRFAFYAKPILWADCSKELKKKPASLVKDNRFPMSSQMMSLLCVLLWSLGERKQVVD